MLKSAGLQMSEVLTPFILQLGVGGIGGFFAGYILKKVFRIALVLGMIAFPFVYLLYRNVISLDFDGLVGTVSKFTDSLAPLGLTTLMSSLPFIGSAFVGMMAGFKQG